MQAPHGAIVPAAEDVTPLSFIWLEITAKCNLECEHCYADSGPHRDVVGSMTMEDWLRVLRESYTLGCRQVQFIGGEPVLHPKLPELISHARELGYSFVEVFTNATHLDDRLLSLFTQYDVHIAVSFYSDRAAVHDSITGRKGSFDRTVRNLRRMLAAGLSIRAALTEMEQNANQLERAVAFLHELGIHDVRTDSRRGIGRGVVALPPADPMAELCGECWKGRLCITCAGRVFPCVFSRFVDLGSAKEGIGRILESRGLGTFQRELQERLAFAKPNLVAAKVGECTPRCNPVEFKRCMPAVASVSATCDPSCNPPVFPPNEPAPSCGPVAAGSVLSGNEYQGGGGGLKP